MSVGLLSLELAVYEHNRGRLVAEAAGRWVVVANSNLQGIWETYEDALKHAYDSFGLDPFLVKKIDSADAVSWL